MSYPKDPTNVESHNPKLASMAIVGHTTRSACRLWVRVYRPGRWWLVVTKRPLSGDLDTLDGKQVDAFARGAVYCRAADISSARDNTHTFRLQGLEPGTRYYYALIADLADAAQVPRRTEIGHQQKAFFETLPAAPGRLTFGYYSCHDPFSTTSHSEGAWPNYYEALVERQAAFSIGGGDQVYVDTNDKEDMYSVWQWLALYKNDIVEAFSDARGRLRRADLVDYFAKIYRGYYRIYWNFVNLRKCYARFPQYMIWDDHEIMDGWGSYTRAERSRLLNRLLQDDDEKTNAALVELMFEAAKRVYFEYQHDHNPRTMSFDVMSGGANEACIWDYGFKAGRFAFYVLDVRGHHDYGRARRGLGNALLGDAQMARLEQWLQSGPVRSARAVFIVTPVPVVHWGPLASSADVGSMKDDLRDEWEHESNREERNKLLDVVLGFSAARSAPVVFLSGDVHSASVYRIENHVRFPGALAFNATSSAISRKPAPALAEHLIRKSGRISGYEDGHATRLYALAGAQNFLIVDAHASGAELRLDLDLYRPAGDEGEVTKKKVTLV